MPKSAHQPWTTGQFFAWQANQPDRYELVRGYPVRMMAGARNVHDDIVVNLIAELRSALKGRDCRPFTGDSSVQTRVDQIRRPDAGVDCGARDPDGLSAAQPKLVAEVLSPTTRDFDSFEKLDEYQTVASIDYILLIESNAPQVSLQERLPDGRWKNSDVEGLDQTIELPGLGITLKMSEIYDRVQFPPRPRLVRREA